MHIIIEILSYVASFDRRTIFRAGLAAIGLTVLSWWLVSDREIRQFPLGDGQTLSVYLSVSMKTRDPFAVRCEVVAAGQPGAQRRDIFLGNEMPDGIFAIERTRAGLVALIYEEDVVFVHDLPSGSTWPDQQGRTTGENYLFLVESLNAFKAEGKDLPCRRRVYFESDDSNREFVQQTQ